ncbi:Wiskott-Aldrich syndrome protein family member 2-like [Oopsacas minuta]|uniref:Wiskott-Aldrich syndrome protein family member 2-like n=1 Tax=Oopsacas minuta TaxID=111878 RepID=A0AAV7JX23_9METZ|nr:Wiskott-Aldrich syndrome protein family member 2-like [Oopsacas minuta]
MKQKAAPSPSVPIHDGATVDTNESSKVHVEENGIENNPSPKLSRSHSPQAVAPPHHPTNTPPSAPYVPSDPIPTDSMTSETGHRHPKRSAPSAPAPVPPSSLPPQPSSTTPTYSPPTPATSTYCQPPPPPQQPREPSPPPANIPAPPPNMPNVPDDLPPSPPLPADSTIDARSSILGEMGAARDMLKTVEKKTAPIDARDGLLLSIKQGTTLRKVEKRKEEPPQPSRGNDVASILARRIAIEISDSDSEYDDDYSDDEDWDTN